MFGCDKFSQHSWTWEPLRLTPAPLCYTPRLPFPNADVPWRNAHMHTRSLLFTAIITISVTQLVATCGRSKIKPQIKRQEVMRWELEQLIVVNDVTWHDMFQTHQHFGPFRLAGTLHGNLPPRPALFKRQPTANEVPGTWNVGRRRRHSRPFTQQLTAFFFWCFTVLSDRYISNAVRDLYNAALPSHVWLESHFIYLESIHRLFFIGYHWSGL